MSKDIVWQTKLACSLHDLAKKALVLLHDPAGHENGTSQALIRLLGLTEITGQELAEIQPDNPDISSRAMRKQRLQQSEVYTTIQRADRWAAAADCPQWPMQETATTTKSGEKKAIAVADWAQVRWSKNPVLTHPLSGDQLELHSLPDTQIDDIKTQGLAHFSKLWEQLGAQDETTPDLRKIQLAFWRFGPELSDKDDNGRPRQIWPLLPADPRVPDHSIWDHLDLTSAFAGAFAADPDGEAALLALSIGPVQGFIAAARSTSDLWAGSHLLSRMAWETIRPLCEELGPDTILFPRLRGIPQVDLWLRDGMGLPDTLFTDCEWNKDRTDANPLFSAALPNRLVAVVPAGQAKALAEKVTEAVRDWLRGVGEDVVSRLLKAAGYDVEGEKLPYEQMRKQLAGFPEVHWAAVPFSLVKPRNATGQTDLDTSGLSEAMAPFFGVEPGKPCGFLDTPAWQALSKQIDWGDGTTFFAPNPGVLYPAVYDLAERVMAAAKATRTFNQTREEGWRCSLTGEAEWLTTDRTQLDKSYRQQSDTLWAKIAKTKPAWAKKGEHLSALPAIKRLWPTVFKKEVDAALAANDGSIQPIDRFVISTHTMALADQLDKWLEKGGLTATGFAEAAGDVAPVALPRRLIRRHPNKAALRDAKRLPALLEQADATNNERVVNYAKNLVRKTLATALGQDAIQPETYYGLLMMDGDKMGAILSGDEATDTTISYRASLHPQVQKGFDAHAAKQPLIQAYGEQKRVVSPNRHLAISGALHDFSQIVVRHVVEEEHLGRILYAGGDDVLAMLPVTDLLSTMHCLRYAYSGIHEEDAGTDGREVSVEHDTLHCQNGFAWLSGRLMRMMGRTATASTGAVVAHHQAPLSAVLRELRAAERRAKTEGGRDAFSITIIKRSGGALRLTAKWGEPLKLLMALRNFLAEKDTSRRAVYRTLEWLKDLPQPKDAPEMLEGLLAYQLARQSDDAPKDQAASLARRLASLAAQREKDGLRWLENFLTVAEFLARETRTGGAV